MKRENEFYKNGMLYYSVTGFRKVTGRSYSFIRQRIKDGIIHTEKEYYGVNQERTIIPYTEIDVLKEWEESKKRERIEGYLSAIKGSYTEDVFTKKEVSEKLNVTVSTIERYIRDGKLETVWIDSPRTDKIQMRVIPASELDRVLKNRKDQFQKLKKTVIEKAISRGISSMIQVSGGER